LLRSPKSYALGHINDDILAEARRSFVRRGFGERRLNEDGASIGGRDAIHAKAYIEESISAPPVTLAASGLGHCAGASAARRQKQIAGFLARRSCEVSFSL
jgi:hypothetical protein